MVEDDEITQPIIQRPPLSPLTHEQRCTMFGKFSFTPNPQPGNPEHVAIEHDWLSKNIVQISTPQLNGRRIAIHRLAAEPFRAVWDAWDKAGLRDRIVTFDGAFASRYKRGKSGAAVNLSNHAWGSAFDVNARWNPLGHLPAGVGSQGCVLELVGIAERHGWFWGGHFAAPRQDAMHFEIARL